VGGRDQEPVLVDVYLADFVSVSGLEHNALPIFKAGHKHLRKWNVGKFKFSFVARFFKADFKNVDWAADGADAKFGSIRFPAGSSDRVVVFDLLAADLVPLWSLGVEVVDIKPVEVAYQTGFTRGIETGTCELLDFFIFWIIKPLEAVTCGLVERNFAVIATGNDVGSPAEGVGDGWVHDLALVLGVEVEGDYGVVEEPSNDTVAVGGGWNAHHKGFLAEEWLTFVGFWHADAHFSFCGSDNQVIGALVGPGHAGDGRALEELVADRFLFSPLGTNLVHKDDVVWLCDGKFLWIRGEGHGAHNVAAVALLSGPDRELVSLLALLVEQMDHSIRGGNCVALAILGPSDGRYFLHSVNGLL
jgi:hypothetical protein